MHWSIAAIAGSAFRRHFALSNTGAEARARALHFHD